MILDAKIDMCLQSIGRIDNLIRDLDTIKFNAVEENKIVHDLRKLKYAYETRLLELNLIKVKKIEIEEWTPPHVQDTDETLKFPNRITKNQK